MKKYIFRILRPCGPYAPELNELQVMSDNKTNRRLIKQGKDDEIEVIRTFKREDFGSNIDNLEIAQRRAQRMMEND